MEPMTILSGIIASLVAMGLWVGGDNLRKRLIKYKQDAEKSRAELADYYKRIASVPAGSVVRVDALLWVQNRIGQKRKLSNDLQMFGIRTFILGTAFWILLNFPSPWWLKTVFFVGWIMTFAGSALLSRRWNRLEKYLDAFEAAFEEGFWAGINKLNPQDKSSPSNPSLPASKVSN